MVELITPNIQDTLIIDGKPTVEFHTWMANVTQAAQPPITGSGNPEGVVQASPGRFYVDLVGGIWFKQTGDGKTGWALK